MTTSPVSRTLLRTFWLGVLLLTGYALFQVGRVPPLYVLIGAGLALFALLPTYLWCAPSFRLPNASRCTRPWSFRPLSPPSASMPQAVLTASVTRRPTTATARPCLLWCVR